MLQKWFTLWCSTYAEQEKTTNILADNDFWQCLSLYNRCSKRNIKAEKKCVRSGWYLWNPDESMWCQCFLWVKKWNTLRKETPQVWQQKKKLCILPLLLSTGKKYFKMGFFLILSIGNHFLDMKWPRRKALDRQLSLAMSCCKQT